MKRMYLLVGNIGSGKSTKAAQMAQSGDCVVISRDSMRHMLAGGGYSLSHEQEITISLLVLLRSLMKKGIDVVIDETNLVRKYRKDKINYAKEFGYKCIAVVMPKISQAESVLRRITDNCRGTSAAKWADIHESFDHRTSKPTKQEGFDEIIHLS